MYKKVISQMGRGR